MSLSDAKAIPAPTKTSYRRREGKNGAWFSGGEGRLKCGEESMYHPGYLFSRFPAARCHLLFLDIPNKKSIREQMQESAPLTNSSHGVTHNRVSLHFTWRTAHSDNARLVIPNPIRPPRKKSINRSSLLSPSRHRFPASKPLKICTSSAQ